ncbi:MAG: TIGR03087 family PEP-CTERM/XrtA system glycosyltransferase [Alkalimonas sp.]|nr:TIGR03087 family PEP-CTERM/XrtA system glycosyltransferase [Alkalimonas sp.]
MNILYLAHRVPFPADKGEKIRTYHQIKYLVEQGHQLTILAPIEEVDEATFAAELQQTLPVKVVTAKLGSGLWRKVSALLTGQPISQTHFYSPELLVALKDLLTTVKLDAVVCTSSAMAIYLDRAGMFKECHRSATLLMDFMDLDSDKWQQYANNAAWPMRLVYQREAKLVAQAEQRIYQQFDHCFFISDNEVQLFARRQSDASKVSVLANGLDTSVFYPASSPATPVAPVFLFTGVMNYKPNEDAVLWFVQSMWQQVLAKYPGARFVIAGMQPSSRILQLAKIPGIEVTGYVDDILPYYHQASIFIAPFRLARGVQNKILQAMACGLPVITTPMGAEGIACQHGVHLLTASDEAEFVASIERLQAEPDLRLALQSNGPELIRQQYSWEGVLQTLPELLQQRQEASA